jgi:16S rRNA (cytosine1402-N4)-methyltransferase
LTPPEDELAAHEPVLLDRCVQLLAPPQPGGLIVDATLGLGGHSEAILTTYPEATVLGLDRDPAALALAGARLARFGPRFRPAHTVFDRADEVLDDLGTPAPAGYLFDLGVSSMQLDSDARGFAYARDTHLDMRMDPNGPLTAQDVVNDYTGEELARVFSEYGEERFARRIAAGIERSRRVAPITSSQQLTDIIRGCVPPDRRRKGHPGKRVFQALRIEVNDELGSLRRGLAAAVRRVMVGGHIVVLSYHSLEDRIVKRLFAAGVNPPVPPGMPFVPAGAQPFLTALTRGAETVSADEAQRNPRASSVRLRAVVKVADTPSDWQAAA